MKILGARPALWIFGTACSAVLALSHAGATQAQMPPGQIIMNNACMSCHEYRPIQMQALDKDGWTSVVHSMIEKGAMVKPEDIPVLVDYLVQEHGPLPEGAGKRIMLEICTQCHDLHRVRETFGTRDEWEDILVHMLNEGAPLSDEDFPVLLNYLARNFRPPE